MLAVIRLRISSRLPPTFRSIIRPSFNTIGPPTISSYVIIEGTVIPKTCAMQ